MRVCVIACAYAGVSHDKVSRPFVCRICRSHPSKSMPCIFNEAQWQVALSDLSHVVLFKHSV
jgi:hypothetical protein